MASNQDLFSVSPSNFDGVFTFANAFLPEMTATRQLDRETDGPIAIITAS